MVIGLWSNAHLPDAQHIWWKAQIDQMCLTVIQGHWRCHHSADRVEFYIVFQFIATMALSCIISEIKRGISRKSRFFIITGWGKMQMRIFSRCFFHNRLDSDLWPSRWNEKSPVFMHSTHARVTDMYIGYRQTDRLTDWQTEKWSQ